MSWMSAYPCLGPSARLIRISTDASPTRRSTSCPALSSRLFTAIRPPSTSANISVNVVVVSRQVVPRKLIRAPLAGAAGHTAVVGWYQEAAIAVTPPAAEEGRQILRAYFDDVASRYYARPATGDEIAAAMGEDPSDDLAPPRGLLLVAREKGDVLGCAGLR